ncbi:hypothetical protein N7491_001597 [Penicillium cf. griseofulvum]|uniref:Myb-like domain-containing protein n=1 Tax=Penicillium cf. griseofulvum TaxID=2972120 RepID=A0A9W9M905_9EURO|nr:hypothetical protein N7472_006727 [Penicillium cf. griseofulvum]KAJ5445515.1 hypothetical protein N7491_001597 [Penicillium cf. griseofulvum]KAJ5447235.1 hypothetical protein N7445_002056 [Penicillium cf. griseofulvum]
MAHSWDHERDKRLLVAILAVHAPLDFAAVAKVMGQGDSARAVKTHCYTLKTRLEANSEQSNPNDKADKPTGRGRKAPRTPTKRKDVSHTKTENDSVDESQEGDGDESCESPTKQRKL